MKDLKPGQESNPRTMSQYMAAESTRNPKALWESEEEYKQRLYQLARPAFEAFMSEEHAKRMIELYGEKADLRDRLAKQREGFNFQETVRELEKTVQPYPYEEPHHYHRRIVLMARELETASYGGKDAQQARREAIERRLAERDSWRRAQERPVQRPLSVREELNHPKQLKLQRAKEKYTI